MISPIRLFRSSFQIVCLLVMALAASAWGEERGVGPVTGLPLPRFVSLGADKVNVRTGPGSRYPIAWQFQRKSLPVEVVAEFEQWLKIRDHDGAEGWVRRNLLSGTRTALITQDKGRAPMLATPRSDAALRAELEAQVLVRLLKCKEEWCEVEAESEAGRRRGFVLRRALWGVYADEDIK